MPYVNRAFHRLYLFIFVRGLAPVFLCLHLAGKFDIRTEGTKEVARSQGAGNVLPCRVVPTAPLLCSLCSYVKIRPSREV